MNNNVSRQQCIDLWMATDRDRSTLFDHLHRFAVALHASDKRDAADAIAPAEAKGDWFADALEAMGNVSCLEGHVAILADMLATDYPEGDEGHMPQFFSERAALKAAIAALTPQPADGGAVAPQCDAAECLMGSEHDWTVLDCPHCHRCVKYCRKGVDSKAAWRDLTAENKRLRDQVAAHHSACELGAVREASVESFCDAMEAVHGYRPILYREVPMNGRDSDRYEGWMLALQHRGDSRGGETD